ncbi:hypothetical protein G9U51_08315 [Calidifontibacter sp. DB0510]|uniref:Major capsid protein n=1 Tax=Metallococcus carri TaxID=1656884 RepID=A0A967B0I1_9MICO|nr:hypothetical protein [Metallococcus carri]NHN55779.1 hypothetical protein [Metallococcus carri]NOP38532.1 hypothetical protein [Calidifontibacter sp. DB2511S]
MPTYTYPAAPAKVVDDALVVHRLLKSPTLISRRMQSLLKQRYIADAILTGRYSAVGGAIAFESDEPLGTNEEPREIVAGSEYPIVQLGGGALTTLPATSWGQDALVTYKSINRMRIDPVNRALNRLANQNVMKVDKVALGVVASVVPTFTNLSTPWDATVSADTVTGAIRRAADDIDLEGKGFVADQVVLDTRTYTNVMLSFVRAGYLPREAASQNPILTGSFPSIMGLTWLASPHALPGTVLVEDSSALGGMADEPTSDPGYTSAAGEGTAAVLVKSINEEVPERYRLRARRDTVPVVVEPGAGRKITGAGN